MGQRGDGSELIGILGESLEDLNEAKVELGVNNGQVGFEEWMAAHFAEGGAAQGEPTVTPRVDTFGF